MNSGAGQHLHDPLQDTKEQNPIETPPPRQRVSREEMDFVNMQLHLPHKYLVHVYICRGGSCGYC